jgi:hypothetical protein
MFSNQYSLTTIGCVLVFVAQATAGAPAQSHAKAANGPFTIQISTGWDPPKDKSDAPVQSRVKASDGSFTILLPTGWSPSMFDYGFRTIIAAEPANDSVAHGPFIIIEVDPSLNKLGGFSAKKLALVGQENCRSRKKTPSKIHPFERLGFRGAWFYSTGKGEVDIVFVIFPYGRRILQASCPNSDFHICEESLYTMKPLPVEAK